MKVPGGGKDIFGVVEYDKDLPTKLLANTQGTPRFMKEHRSDVAGNLKPE